MAEQENGITQMRRRIERGQRRPPPARRRENEAGEVGEGSGSDPAGVSVGVPTTPRPAPAANRAPAPAGPEVTPNRVRLAADAPSANLAIRVRRPLDERLMELIHQLRRRGVRTSKVELIEMLLWELPADDLAALTGRVDAFRRAAPRGPGAPIEA